MGEKRDRSHVHLHNCNTIVVVKKNFNTFLSNSHMIRRKHYLKIHIFRYFRDSFSSKKDRCVISEEFWK